MVKFTSEFDERLISTGFYVCKNAGNDLFDIEPGSVTAVEQRKS